MNADTKRVILENAAATLDRLSDIKPRAVPVAQDEDALTKWRRGVEQQEKEFAAARAKRKAIADAEQDNAVAWQNWVGQQIRDAVKGVGKGLGEILSDKLVQIGEAFDKRDQRISQLECELYKTQAALERLNLRVIKNEIGEQQDKVIDLPTLPRKQEFN
jgi:hypothetical protein